MVSFLIRVNGLRIKMDNNGYFFLQDTASLNIVIKSKTIDGYI